MSWLWRNREAIARDLEICAAAARQILTAVDEAHRRVHGPTSPPENLP